MKYIEKDVVRAHDVAKNDIVRPSVLWRYMQEVANHSMRDEGPSYPALLQQGLAFLLSRMTMLSHIPLRQHEPITVETWGCPSRGLSFERCYRVLTADGRVAAEGIGTWALLDLGTRRLRRVTDVSLGYSMDASLAELSASNRFRIPSELALETVGTRRVYYSDTDVMGHMNNTNYPDMLCDFLPNPGEGFVRRVSISFQREAALGTDIEIRRAEETGAEAGCSRFYFETRVGGETGIQAMLELAHELPGGIL